MARISITVDDLDVRAAFAALAGAGADLAPAMDEIGAMLVASTIDRFERETGPDGVPWLPSARARAEGGQTLTDSAHLRDSITHRATPDAVEVGTNVIYAAVHQFGHKFPPHTIRPKNGKALFWPGARHPVGKVDHPGSLVPARPYLGFDEADRTEAVAILADHLQGAIDAR